MLVTKRVVFLCTGNSARSQIAEALMRHLSEGRFEVVSAGTNPRSAVHPLALEMLRRNHIPTKGLVPKDIARFAGQRFDYVITVCDRVRERCPVMAGAEAIHWSFPDPTETADRDKQSRVFEEIFHGLERRIRLLMVVTEKDDAEQARGR
jgi:ArsR family transcriptional regulator, arsenate/arsenite/antimonite-responsive transcriptional repressor / arsenate reductase (thioredoxin)